MSSEEIRQPTMKIWICPDACQASGGGCKVSEQSDKKQGRLKVCLFWECHNLLRGDCSQYISDTLPSLANPAYRIFQSIIKENAIF